MWHLFVFSSLRNNRTADRCWCRIAAHCPCGRSSCRTCSWVVRSRGRSPAARARPRCPCPLDCATPSRACTCVGCRSVACTRRDCFLWVVPPCREHIFTVVFVVSFEALGCGGDATKSSMLRALFNDRACFVPCFDASFGRDKCRHRHHKRALAPIDPATSVASVACLSSTRRRRWWPFRTRN